MTKAYPNHLKGNKSYIYDKCQKKQTEETNEEYKQQKSLFKATKKKNPRKCKKAWNSMKEIIAKSKPNTRNLPGRIVIGEKEIFDEKTIAKQFNDYFINIGLTFASNFQT